MIKNSGHKALRIIKDNLINMFSTPSIINKINNANFKGYVHYRFKNKLENEDPHHTTAILNSFKFITLEKIKAEEPQETVAERVKLKRQKTRKGLKIFTPNKLLMFLKISVFENS